MAEQVEALSPAGISELATFIIRPPRASYAVSELGDKNFTCEKVPCVREDVVLTNEKGLKLYGTHFRPADAVESLPTVVYMHGNGSCRVEGTMLLHYIVPYGLALFAFDFSGSGMSGGEYISLGVNEKFDVETVVNHLVDDRGISRIVLWGHSMGAATAVMYAGLCKRRAEVKALVLDSPFASFEKLAQSMVSEMPLPIAVPRKLILTVGVRAVRKAVRDRAGFDVIDIDPLSAARKIRYDLPALFLHGTNDAVVPLNHGEILHKLYPCAEKDLVVLQDSEHDSPRPEWAMDKVHVFLQRQLREFGSTDLQFLDQLKARGNAAMLTGRFSDANALYTEALNSLAQTVVGLDFAQAVGEPPREDRRRGVVDDEGEQNVVRKNSSISSFVSTVKRWRYAHSRSQDNAFSVRSGRSSRANTALSANTSADIFAIPVPESAGASMDWGAHDDKSSDAREEESPPSGRTEELKNSVVSGDERTETQSTQDNPKSEESMISARLEQSTKRNWRTRPWVRNLKNIIHRHQDEFRQQDADTDQLEASDTEDGAEDGVEQNDSNTTRVDDQRHEEKYKRSTRLFQGDRRQDRDAKQSGLRRNREDRKEEPKPSGRLFSRERRLSGRLQQKEDRQDKREGEYRHLGIFQKESRFDGQPKQSGRLFLKESKYVRETRPVMHYERDNVRRREEVQEDNELHRQEKRDDDRGYGQNGKLKHNDGLLDREIKDRRDQKQQGGLFQRDRRPDGEYRHIGRLFHRRREYEVAEAKEADHVSDYPNSESSDKRNDRRSNASKRSDRPDQNVLGGRLSHRGRLRRSHSTSKLSRSYSASRIHIRHRERRSRRQRHSKSIGEGLVHLGQERYGQEEMQDRVGNNDSTRDARQSLDRIYGKATDNVNDRTEANGNLGGTRTIASWGMSEAQKILALALLGNRSLARRKIHDIPGALFDGLMCVRLDPTWIRGYLRKAAALRDDGRLEKARECVIAGLRQDPDHAGLSDMLRSIDLATEAEQLAKERTQGSMMEPSPNGVEAVAGQA